MLSVRKGPPRLRLPAFPRVKFWVPYLEFDQDHIDTDIIFGTRLTSAYAGIGKPTNKKVIMRLLNMGR